MHILQNQYITFYPGSVYFNVIPVGLYTQFLHVCFNGVNQYIHPHSI